MIARTARINDMMTHKCFFRIEGFGIEARHQAGRKGTPWRTIAGVAAEAARKVGAAAHVKGNVAVERLLGEDPIALAEVAVDQARRAKSQGKVKPGRLSPIASAFFGAVASFPESSRERAEDPGFIERYHEWRARLLDWVTKRWGQFRHCVVEHRDEEFWHVHVLIMPPMDEQGRLLVGLVHPGYAARGDLERAGHPSSVANIAYKAAMRDLLDDYHRAVGAPAGHERKGASPRGRRTREQAMIDARQREREQTLNGMERDLLVTQAGLQRRAGDLEARIAAADEARRGYDEMSAALERQRDALQRQRQELEAANEAERVRLEARLARQEAELAKAVAQAAGAQAANAQEKDRLTSVARRLMTADPDRLASQNEHLRAELAEARREIAALCAELDRLIDEQPALRQAM
jgi:hypothetical protein